MSFRVHIPSKGMYLERSVAKNNYHQENMLKKKGLFTE